MPEAKHHGEMNLHLGKACPSARGKDWVVAETNSCDALDPSRGRWDFKLTFEVI